jgi:hypothetical protein
MAALRTSHTSSTLTAGTYRSYLVRFWQSNEQGDWRASTQCVQTGSTLRFGDVESLLTFLQTELGKTKVTHLLEPHSTPD